jgi:hypothetical protein
MRLGFFNHPLLRCPRPRRLRQRPLVPKSASSLTAPRIVLNSTGILLGPRIVRAVGAVLVGTRVLLRDGGLVDDKTIMEYIETHKWDEEQDGFKITVPPEP